MSTAVQPSSDDGNYWFSWDLSTDPNFQYYSYKHIAELETLGSQTRELNLYENGKHAYGPFIPDYMSTLTIYPFSPLKGGSIKIEINKTENSDLPPILNAIEVYMVIDFSQSQTLEVEVNAMMHIKSTYQVKKNSWQGDPCTPEGYRWEGLNCSGGSEDNSHLRIISLNLSSSEMNGEIAPFFGELASLQYFVDDLSSSSRKRNGFVIPLAVSVAATLSALIIGLAIFCSLKARRKHVVAKVETQLASKNDSFASKHWRFAYSDVIKITKNFATVLGRGGFGTVYHGCIDNIDVAVKMLSPSSAQGYKEFHAEVELLMRVHHRNLTAPVGYCIEGANMGLIFEYMPKGTLEQHLSGNKNQYSLSWEERMQIALDAAQAWKAVELALASASYASSKRPTMIEVVMGLKECLAIQLGQNDYANATVINSPRLDSEFTPLAR
ncbi:hypothetical protein Pint_29505 [Pistacia integerrima]|uniref:Uncharacterized protein n=1 Tax=Pistacia integerrima TaxID=434235 RepID=A0ACC0WZE8_9ROSI|nr:hypothetical protein Pint_29505 [Pistacia integerrima]